MPPQWSKVARRLIHLLQVARNRKGQPKGHAQVPLDGRSHISMQSGNTGSGSGAETCAGQKEELSPLHTIQASVTGIQEQKSVEGDEVNACHPRCSRSPVFSWAVVYHVHLLVPSLYCCQSRWNWKSSRFMMFGGVFIDFLLAFWILAIKWKRSNKEMH